MVHRSEFRLRRFSIFNLNNILQLCLVVNAKYLLMSRKNVALSYQVVQMISWVSASEFRLLRWRMHYPASGLYSNWKHSFFLRPEITISVSDGGSQELLASWTSTALTMREVGLWAAGWTHRQKWFRMVWPESGKRQRKTETRTQNFDHSGSQNELYHEDFSTAFYRLLLRLSRSWHYNTLFETDDDANTRSKTSHTMTAIEWREGEKRRSISVVMGLQAICIRRRRRLW